MGPDVSWNISVRSLRRETFDRSEITSGPFLSKLRILPSLIKRIFSTGTHSYKATDLSPRTQATIERMTCALGKSHFSRV